MARERISLILVFIKRDRPQSLHTKCFAVSRMLEFNRIPEQRAFSLVSSSDADGFRIYEPQFVDEVKNTGKINAFENSRLVGRPYNGSGYSLITHARTVQGVSQRLLPTIYTRGKELKCFTRDVSQTYIQFETITQRPIFA